jgi:hypothetical protein
VVQISCAQKLSVHICTYLLGFKVPFQDQLCNKTASEKIRGKDSITDQLGNKTAGTH